MIICTNQHTVCQDCLSTIRTTRKCPYCKVLFNQLNVSKNRTLLNLLDSLNYASIKAEKKTEEKVKKFPKEKPWGILTEGNSERSSRSQLSGTGIHDLHPLENSFHKQNWVSRMYLAHYQEKRSITKIIDLSLFKNLTILGLSNNKIKVIENLHCLPLLLTLNLQEN